MLVLYSDKCHLARTEMKRDEIERLQAKTPAQRFLSLLEQEFHYAPKIAQGILAEA